MRLRTSSAILKDTLISNNTHFIGYQAPAEKSIDDIVNADAEDEALKKYKATLLGSAVAGTGSVVPEPDDPRLLNSL